MDLYLNGEPIACPPNWTFRFSSALSAPASIEVRRSEGFPFEPIPLAAGDVLRVFEGDVLLAEFIELAGRAVSPLEVLV